MIRVTCKVKVYFLGRTLFLILSLSIFTRMIIINTSTAGRTRTVILFPPWGLREVSAHTVICYTSNFIYYTGVVVVVFYLVKKMGPTVAHTPNTRKNFPFQPGNHWGHTSISGLSLFFLSFDFRALNFFFQKIIPSCVCAVTRVEESRICGCDFCVLKRKSLYSESAAILHHHTTPYLYCCCCCLPSDEFE